MITPSYIDPLETMLNTSTFCLEEAQRIAGECLDQSGGAIAPRDSIVVPQSPELKKSLIALIRAHSETEGKHFSQQIIELARPLPH